MPSSSSGELRKKTFTILRYSKTCLLILSSNNDYPEILKSLKDNGGNLDQSGKTLILINSSKILSCYFCSSGDPVPWETEAERDWTGCIVVIYSL